MSASVDRTELDVALATLRAGGVVGAATESSFGLFADALSEAALDRLAALKPRGLERGHVLVLPNLESWGEIVSELPEAALDLARAHWPGPLTIALPARSHVPARLTVDGLVAARWPGASPAAALVAAFGAPLTATSANPPGAPPALTLEELRGYFPGLCALSPRAPGGAPSTLVAWRGEGFALLREGAIPAAQLGFRSP